MARGLDRAEALTVPKGRGFRGRLDLGLKATPDFLGGHLEAIARWKKGPVDLAGYASAWGGMRNPGTGWRRDFGATVGVRGYF